MVTTTEAYTSSRYRTPTGEGFDGIARISCNGSYGTGVLLYDGRAVLTVAHLLASATPGQVSVRMESASGIVTLSSSDIEIHPQYDAVNANYDLALVWLADVAPVAADRYDIYRDSDEIGQTFVMAGYGTQGTGDTGTVSNPDSMLRLQAQNQFDADAATLKNWLGPAMNWTPATDIILVADFDNGEPAHDALGELILVADTGLGSDEGLTAPGDSGGPAFIGGKLAGIASYTAPLSYNSIQPDIDGLNNSSFGEVAFWQRVSEQQQWIDQSLRTAYASPPTQADEIIKTVAEPDNGTIQVFFLLQFTGTRADPQSWISVDYATRDGSALAGSDYLATSGTLILYPDETQAVIPVEIIGDNIAEADETFYLDVFNPVGGSFGQGVIQLSAIRTIINEDQ